MRKICVVTGTRAEYGQLARVMRMIKESSDTQLQIVATNMHLSPKFGNTYQEIVDDGFDIDYRVPIIDDNGPNDALATVYEMSRGLAGFGEAYQSLQPNLVLVLGDRYEILAAASAALIERIPIAHIAGGDITEGAYDDSIRHCITKLSHLHFTTTEEYRKRVIQLGEQPERVFNVGSLGVENIKKLSLFTKDEIESNLGFKINKQTILVTYHPVTLGGRSAKDDIEDFLSALDERKDIRVVFTMPNSDTGGQYIVEAIEGFVKDNYERARAYRSLGVKRYLSLMKEVAAVVGNSSSGLVEVPSFGLPTLNIGDRQKGRIEASSVYDCNPDKESVLRGLEVVFSSDFQRKASNSSNPYEKENTAEEIFKIIKTYPLEKLGQKHFYNL